MPRARTATALFSVFLLLLSSCGGRAPKDQHMSPTGPSVFATGSKIRSVAITYDGLDAERLKRLEAYRAHETLRTNVESRLGGSGRLDPSGDLELVIHLDTFRLRSSASAFWLGAMAGADRVVADVRVTRNGSEIRNFKTDTSTMLGGMFYASATRRTARLMKTLSERIVTGL